MGGSREDPAMAVDIDEVISRLQRADGPSRRLDGEIATVLGWRVTPEIYLDQETNERRERRVWLLPNSDKIASVPRYTAHLNAAYTLARSIAPTEKSGCS